MVLITLVQTDILLTKTQANPVATSPQSREVASKTKHLPFPVGRQKYQNCFIPYRFPWVPLRVLWRSTHREAKEKCIKANDRVN